MNAKAVLQVNQTKEVLVVNNFFKVTFSILLLLSFVGCKEEDENMEENSDLAMDLSEYMNTVELPENFSLEFDPEEVTAVDEASVHKASILDFSEKNSDTIIETLVQGEIIDTKNYAEGPWLEAEYNEAKEYLTIYDGGKSLGMDGGMNGGLIYANHINNMGRGSETVVSSVAGPPHLTDQLHGYGVKSDFESKTDLDFMSYTGALAEVKKTLKTIGFPKVVEAETYSLDLETIKAHYELYFEHRLEEEEEYDWTKEDESYLFIFQQVINDIPLVDIGWVENTGMPGSDEDPFHEIGNTTSSVLYSKDGFIDLAAYNLVDDIESGEEQSLISQTKALKLLIDSYSDILFESETAVTSLVLNYVTLLKGDNHYELIPAWIFEISEANEWDDPVDATITPYYDYSYFVVNAITGDQIEIARDLE